MGNRNKKIVPPVKSNRSSKLKSKCTKIKLINQQMSGRNNNTQASLDNRNAMIDDCGGSGAIVGIGNEDDEDPNNGAGISFVQEWINTYAFISREFISSYYFLIFLL